ncbi:FecR domain-containing protein [Insolitispirillum peregrinum]|uniref:FecR domain-containing protein n=1 Tax=Insolitispirillum peregrinum TaxID=80876 RepID=UPI003614D84F
MALGPSSALTLDEVLFDPAAEKVGMGVRLAQGTFSFLSGQIPKLAPDKTVITTPVATIGIRGTRFLVEVNSND